VSGSAGSSPVSAPTIAVLSSWFGGVYFGGILSGIAEAVQAAGGRVLAVQTLEAGTYGTDLAAPPDFRLPVGWDRAAGFVVVLNAVDREYLTALRGAGKPVVLISNVVEGFPAPVVLPDNRMGTRSAVEHLLDHGHRHIAFAGFPVQSDLAERYDSYRQTLQDHGITPDPALFYDTGNSQQSGGEVAAAAMLAAGLPSTAVVCGNDNNALGLMRALQHAGVRLPGDQAIVGFDDVNAAVYLSPSLTSVRQPLEGVGRRAVELLLDELAGRPVDHGLHYAPTTLITRESCGCPSRLTLDESAPAGGLPEGGTAVPARDELLARIVAAFDAVGRQVPGQVVRAAVDAVCDALDAAAEGRPAAGPARWQGPFEDLYAQGLTAESLVQVMRAVRTYADALAAPLAGRAGRDGRDGRDGDGRAARRVEERLRDVIVALAGTEARYRYAEAAHFETTFGTQYAVSVNLLRGGSGEDPRLFRWLEGTPARAACLGLWAAPGDVAPDVLPLEITGVFDAAGAGQLPVGTVEVAAFPPQELVALADLARGDMAFVAPLRVNASDWGLLAVVGPIEGSRISGREIMNQWGALLTTALDHGAVLESLRRQRRRLRRQKAKLRRQKDRLRHAATHDALTGLPNRVLFHERLEDAVARAARGPGSRYGVFLLDLDGFKRVNDTLGHAAGDQLLTEVSRRISDSLPAGDLAARLGGDEFAVLLDGLLDPAEAVERVVGRIRDALARPILVEGQELVVGASIGVAVGDSRYGTPQDVLRDADIAMYWAKGREKGTHAVFDAAMHDQGAGRLRVEAELRHALEQGELELHYQPIVELRTGRITAWESFPRWRHPRRGLIPAEEFLPVAEECGLVLPIGRWALGEACRQLARWHRPGAPQAQVAVKVTARQFWHGDLLDDVVHAARTAGLPPSSLCLEITEGVAMRDLRLACSLLDGLAAVGVECWLDGFGTGGSSFRALQHLPVRTLKLDRSFIAATGPEGGGRDLVRAITAMAAGAGRRVVADGVETREQLEFLRTLGCEAGQGTWFSPPVPADVAETLVTRQPLHGIPRQDTSPR